MSQTIGVQDLSVPATNMEEILSVAQKDHLEASPLILSTTYSLNHSATKKITVGLQLRVDGSIQPIVQFQNNSSSGGIVFDSEAWSLLQSHLPAVSKFFTGGQKVTASMGHRVPAPIRVGDNEILFTSAYGSKAVAFDRYRRGEFLEAEDHLEDEGPTRKYGKYAPVILMQKGTFNGLLNILVCVDERFRRLQRNVTHVQKCADVLCAELQLHIPIGQLTDNVDCFEVRELIKNNNKSLKEAVRLRQDASFADHTFPIVFLELSVLCTEYIAHELRKALAARKKLTPAV